MKLSEVKKHLDAAEAVNFQLPNGNYVPEHFHVTEVGIVSKHFIDCEGKVRNEKIANFQLWNTNDTEHRLKPQKFQSIIALSEQVLGMEDLEVEVEYQSDTIGKYGMDYNGKDFLLTLKHTDCLAKDACSVPAKEKLKLSDLQNQEKGCCAPGGACC